MHAKKAAKAQVSHAGTVSMLLNEMNDFVSTKGESGLDPDEIEHIHGIRALIDETVLPTILEGVEQNRAELDALYQAILGCHEHADLLSNVTVSKDYTRTRKAEFHKVCVKLEETLIVNQKKACEQLNRSRMSIFGPGEEDVPVATEVAEEWIRYLETMDDFFCGRMDIFKDEWEDCNFWTENFTQTHQLCKSMQKEFETVTCSWKKVLKTSCEEYDTCWTQSVTRYNERKRAIMDLQGSRQDSYIGATKIQCLWSAWIYEGMPCTVNKTRIKECNEYPPNLTNITIEFPSPPSPPDCTPSNDVSIDVCSEEWLEEEYGRIGLTKEHFDDLKATCQPCPTHTYTSAPSESGHVHLLNIEHASGDTYIKINGENDCMSYIESVNDDVQSVVVYPSRNSGIVTKMQLTTHGNDTYAIEMENGVVSSDLDMDPEMYSEGDSIVGTFSSGKLTFLKVKANQQSEVFGEMDVDSDMGIGMVTLCAPPGTSIRSVFTTKV